MILDPINYNWNKLDFIINNAHMTVREQFETIKKIIIQKNILPKETI